MFDKTKPIHPGEVLLEVYMKPSCPELTGEALSETLRVSQQSITRLINGHLAITPSMAVRLGVIFRTTPDYWLNLQRMYDTQIGNKKGARERRRKQTQTGHSAAA